MQPLDARTLQIHGFKLGPKKLRYADFTWIFSKNLCTYLKNLEDFTWSLPEQIEPTVSNL